MHPFITPMLLLIFINAQQYCVLCVFYSGYFALGTLSKPTTLTLGYRKNTLASNLSRDLSPQQTAADIMEKLNSSSALSIRPDPVLIQLHQTPPSADGGEEITTHSIL
jgi:hypothetical protein